MAESHPSAAAVRALLSPSSVAIVGASDRAGSWSKRVWQELTRNNFASPVYAINPRYETIWDGQTCYPSFDALPQRADHVVVLVPGAAAIEAIAEAGRAGARSATIFSSGFGEGGDEVGRTLGAQLRQAIIDSGLAVSGPNCLGNLAARSSFKTLTDERIAKLERGPVAVFGQSGGIVTAIYRSLAARGIQPGYAITAGNELGLSAADYIRYFVEDEDTQVIVCFIESIRDSQAFRAACLAARDAGKPVVAMKIGGSEESRRAALAHTGSLAGSLQCFDAVAQTIGLVRAATIDDLVELVEVFTHGHRPAGARVGALTFSGGLKGLLLEAAARHGVNFPALAPHTTAELQKILGVGTSPGNPLDAGFTALSSTQAYLDCVAIMQRDPNIDVLLVQEELPAREGMNRKAGNLVQVGELAAHDGATPIGVISIASYAYSDYTRTFRQRFANLPVLHEVDKGLRALDAAGRWNSARLAAIASAAAGEETQPARPLSPAAQALLAHASAGPDGRRVLDEARSKQLIALYGIAAPREAFAVSADEAAQAAASIGYPLVLKLVSPQVQHKSEVGGVITSIMEEAQLRAAFAAIATRLAQHDPYAHFAGVLVAAQAPAGVELIMGIHRDPEVGHVVMFGAGGVLVELARDVVFGAVPLTRSQANSLISASLAGKLLAGFRGAPACDLDVVSSTLMALSQLALDLGDQLESIDLNPVIALPGAGGVLALDALVVLRAPDSGVPS